MFGGLLLTGQWPEKILHIFFLFCDFFHGGKIAMTIIGPGDLVPGGGGLTLSFMKSSTHASRISPIKITVTEKTGIRRKKRNSV